MIRRGVAPKGDSVAQRTRDAWEANAASTSTHPAPVRPLGYETWTLRWQLG